MQLRPIALLPASLAGLMVAVSGGSSFALTAASTSQNSSQKASSLVAQASEPGEACDLYSRLVARVVRNTLLDRTYSTRSRMEINLASRDKSFALEAQVTTLTQAPGQFRSELLLTDATHQSQSEYLLVSNGEQVWIYDKLSDRYSTLSRQAFDDSDDSLFIGFMASLGLSIQADFSSMELMRQVSEAQMAAILTESIAPCQQPGLSFEPTTAQGQSYQTFSYEDETEGASMTMTGFMNQTTSQLDYFTFSSREGGVELHLSEEIMGRTAMPQLDATTFEFIPPATAQEAEEPISISGLSTK